MNWRPTTNNDLCSASALRMATGEALVCVAAPVAIRLRKPKGVVSPIAGDAPLPH